MPDVDFLRRNVRVERQRDSRGEGFTTPKTRSSARTVPLGQVVVDERAAHLAVYGAAADGSLFTDELGRSLTYESWKRIRRATGTTCGTTRPLP